METEIKSYLADIRQAAQRIIEVTLNKPFEEFEGDWVVRAAVERQFLIIGEATNVIAAKDEAIAALLGQLSPNHRLPQHPRPPIPRHPRPNRLGNHRKQPPRPTPTSRHTPRRRLNPTSASNA